MLQLKLAILEPKAKNFNLRKSSTAAAQNIHPQQESNTAAQNTHPQEAIDLESDFDGVRKEKVL
jgi:hypothetical protein